MAWNRSNLKNVAKGVGVIGAIVLYATFPLVAPHLFGVRGSLSGWFFEWLVLFLVFGVLFAVLLRLSWPIWRADAPKWFYFAFLFVGGMLLLSGGGAVRDAGDMLLPFNERDLVIAKTYYDSPQGGRGQVPENGGWHIVTADGDEYKVRPNGGGDSLHPGSYSVELSHFKHIVMAASLRQ